MFKNFDKRAINIKGLKVSRDDKAIYLSNEKLNLSEDFPKILSINITDDLLSIAAVSKISASDDKRVVGTFMANLRSIIKGLKEGHKKVIRFTGTKADAEVANRLLRMSIGLSHDVMKALPDNIDCKVLSKSSKEILLEVVSSSKQCLGQFCSEIIKMDSNPYKGGVHIEDSSKPKVFRERKKKGA